MVGMTRKIAISIPDDVAARLDREPNISAFITESLRIRMAAESVRNAMAAAGFELTDEGRARAANDLDTLNASVSPELRSQAVALRARIKGGRP